MVIIPDICYNFGTESANPQPLINNLIRSKKMISNSITDFPLIPASKLSINRRKLLHGKAINNATYLITQSVNKKSVTCPIYQVWLSMITRCYSLKALKKRPTYIECSVCPEWLYFMAFRQWMVTEGWHGKHLDKDILVTGNKIYRPETCLFVTQAINVLFTDHGMKRGLYPIGVCFHKSGGNFSAEYCVNGKTKYLGSFQTPEEAHQVYLAAKSELVYQVALEQATPLKTALIRISGEIARGEYYK